jgi:hypothetical protein
LVKNSATLMKNISNFASDYKPHWLKNSSEIGGHFDPIISRIVQYGLCTYCTATPPKLCLLVLVCPFVWEEWELRSLVLAGLFQAGLTAAWLGLLPNNPPAGINQAWN